MCLIMFQAEVESLGLFLREISIWVEEMYTQWTEE